jgi:hypothetical protein
MFDNRPGNSNAGHWFTNGESQPGRIRRALTEPEKFAIIEYLKAATCGLSDRAGLAAGAVTVFRQSRLGEGLACGAGQLSKNRRRRVSGDPKTRVQARVMGFY